MKKNKVCFLGISLCLLYSLSSCKKPMVTDNQTQEKLSNLETRTDFSTMLFSGVSGPITAAEIADFKTKMNAVSNPPANDENVWLFKTPGKAVEACGLSRYQTLTVTAHANCSYSAGVASFPMGDYDTGDIVSRGGLDNGISSLKIPPGLKVIVYTGSGYTGTSKTFTTDDACLIDDGINDQISSLKVMSN